MNSTTEWSDWKTGLSVLMVFCAGRSIDAAPLSLSVVTVWRSMTQPMAGLPLRTWWYHASARPVAAIYSF